MKLRKLAATSAASGILMLSMSGLALAADEVVIEETGANSTNTVTITNSQSLTVNNNQNVTVTNTNNQTATSGDATASQNTNGGNATSGDATNEASFTTHISFSGQTFPAPGGGTVTVGGGSGGGTTPTGNVGGGSSTTGTKGGVGGGHLASASGGVGGGTLPDTGATGPIDLEQLRNVFKPSAHAQAMANETNNTSRALLAAGALLSLLGAIGSAIYANKKEVKS